MIQKLPLRLTSRLGHLLIALTCVILITDVRSGSCPSNGVPISNKKDFFENNLKSEITDGVSHVTSIQVSTVSSTGDKKRRTYITGLSVNTADSSAWNTWLSASNKCKSNGLFTPTSLGAKNPLTLTATARVTQIVFNYSDDDLNWLCEVIFTITDGSVVTTETFTGTSGCKKRKKWTYTNQEFIGFFNGGYKNSKEGCATQGMCVQTRPAVAATCAVDSVASINISSFNGDSIIIPGDGKTGTLSATTIASLTTCTIKYQIIVMPPGPCQSLITLFENTLTFAGSTDKAKAGACSITIEASIEGQSSTIWSAPVTATFYYVDKTVDCDITGVEIFQSSTGGILSALTAQSWTIQSTTQFTYQLAVNTATTCYKKPTFWTLTTTSTDNGQSVGKFQTISNDGLFSIGTSLAYQYAGTYNVQVTSVTLNGVTTYPIKNTDSSPNYFLLTVINPCVEASVTESSVADIFVNLNEIYPDILFDAFSYVDTNQVQTLCGTFAYSVSLSLDTALNDLTTFRLNQENTGFQVFSGNINQVGTFTATLTGKLSSYPSQQASSTFQITVNDPCLTTKINSAKIQAMQASVLAASGAVNQQAPEFTDVASVAHGNGTDVCGKRLYQIASTPNVPAHALTSTQLSIGLQSGIISLYTNNSANIGTHTATVTVKLANYEEVTAVTTSFQVTITGNQVPINTAPYFTNFTESTFNLSLLNSDQIQFGSIQDAQLDDVSSNFTISPSSSCFAFDQSIATIFFNISCLNASAKSAFDVTYRLSINLTDNNPTNPLSKIYQITLIVPQIVQNTSLISNQTVNNSTNSTQESTKTNFEQVDKTTQVEKNIAVITSIFPGFIIPNTIDDIVKKSPPYLKKMSIDNQGLLKVTFSEDLMIPSNISMINETVVRLEILPYVAGSIKDLNFTRKVDKFTNNYLTIQLTFEKPLYLSQNANNPDKIKLTMMNNIFFMSKSTFLIAKPNEELISKILPQLSSNAAANAALSSVTGTASQASTAIVAGNFAVNLILSSSLSLLWGMINALQIISNLPLLMVKMPANASSFYTFIVNIANFDIIPTDRITNYFVGTSSDNSNVKNTNSSTRILRSKITNSTNFNIQGINSDNIIENLGPIFLVMLLGGILLVLLIVLYFFRKTACFQCVYKKISNILFWNFTLRYLLEGYLQLVMAELLQIQGGLSWNSTSKIMNSTYTLVMFIICTITPAGLSLYLYKNFSRFNDESFIQRFEYTRELSKRTLYAVAYPSIFCYRRLLFVLVILFLPNFESIQVTCVVIINLFTIILVGATDPFPERRAFFMELFNESTIMLCTYHFYFFTDFVPSPDSRYTMGYSLIVLTCINLLGNLIVMIGTAMLKIYPNLRRIYSRWNFRRSERLTRAKKLLQAQCFDYQTHVQQLQKEQEDYFKKVAEEQDLEENLGDDSSQSNQDRKNERRNRRSQKRAQNALISDYQSNQGAISPYLIDQAIEEAEYQEEDNSDRSEQKSQQKDVIFLTPSQTKILDRNSSNKLIPRNKLTKLQGLVQSQPITKITSQAPSKSTFVTKQELSGQVRQNKFSHYAQKVGRTVAKILAYQHKNLTYLQAQQKKNTITQINLGQLAIQKDQLDTNQQKNLKKRKNNISIQDESLEEKECKFAEKKQNNKIERCQEISKNQLTTVQAQEQNKNVTTDQIQLESEVESQTQSQLKSNKTLVQAPKKISQMVSAKLRPVFVYTNLKIRNFNQGLQTYKNASIVQTAEIQSIDQNKISKKK